jgi:hypothetical protein
MATHHVGAARGFYFEIDGPGEIAPLSVQAGLTGRWAQRRTADGHEGRSDLAVTNEDDP